MIVFSWTNLEGDDPLMIARNTVFFKTVELAYHQGKRLIIVYSRDLMCKRYCYKARDKRRIIHAPY